MIRACWLHVAAAVAACACSPLAAHAQSALGTGFTYQGEVYEGDARANGTYDLAFTLYNDTVAIASPICFDNVDVVDGRFTVRLDFGAAAFSGQRRYVEIAIRADSTSGNCSSPTGYSILSPRQELTAQPYALSAVAAANATLLAGSPASFFTNASNLSSGTIPIARLSSAVPNLTNGQTFSGANVFNNPANVFVGSGSGLTDLDASRMSAGTLPNERLSPDVARLSLTQTWPGAQTFSNPANSYAGSGSSLTDLNASSLTTGTISNLRLPPNVARTDYAQTWSLPQTMTNIGNQIAGSGSGLTDLNASNLTTGTISNLRLPSNVARTDFTQTWTSPQYMNNSANQFGGTGTLLTGLNASNIASGTLDAARLPATALQTNVPAAISADYRFSSMSMNTNTDASADFRLLAARSNAIFATQSSSVSNSAAIRAEVTATTGSVYAGYFSSTSAQGAAVLGSSSTGTGVWGRVTGAGSAGVYGSSSVPGAEGVKAINFATDPGAYAVKAQTYSTTGSAVYAEGLASAGSSHGLWGASYSPDGYGVLAANITPDGTALKAANASLTGIGRAIYATVNGDNATAIEALQSSNAPTGTQIALKASTYSTSPNAWAGFFTGRVYMDSRLHVGYGSPEAMVHISRASSVHPTPFRIDVDGVPKFIVAQQGATGIGTNNPNARLHVNGSAGESALRVSVDGATKLNVRDNGGIVIGGLTAAPPADGLLVNHQIILRDADANRDNDLWIGPAYDFEAAHVVVNGDGTESLLALSNQDAAQFRVRSDGATSIGTDTVPPNHGLYVLGNVVIGAAFPLPPQKLYVSGDAEVTGNLAKAGGSFKIDHPLDPTNQYLYHSFVESPDMMNIYNGNIVTDSEGFATVTLPEWFEALNRDFRYQLTVIDSGDDDFVLARVYRKIEKNAFVIKTSRPTTEVSWQVTGVRKDPWAERHRIPVEEPKDAAHKGTYLHPELYEAR